MRIASILPVALLATACTHTPEVVETRGPTTDDATWFFLTEGDLAEGPHHTRHADVFGRYVTGYNAKVLEGIDRVQATAPDGGGYFIGIRAVPTESPVGYQLTLLDKALLDPPRTTSYCSGASYAAFIEGLNCLYEGDSVSISPERLEALRMQEPDGGRREDTVKYWGKWNDDGFGSHYALVQYSGMGQEITPKQARPGDFMNISWTNGGGHSVVFLGWYRDGENGGEPKMLYWASQTGTNGLGDQLVPISRIRHVKTVRLTEPDNLFTYDVETPVERKIPGDVIDTGDW